MAMPTPEKQKQTRVPANVDIFKKEDFGNEKVNATITDLQDKLKQSMKNKKDRDQVYKCYIDLGAAFYRLFRYEEAETCCWKHLSMARERKFLNEEQVKTALTNLGCVLKQKMLYKEALKHYKEALEIAERIKDDRAHARILNNMGNIYEIMFDFDSAEECFEKRAEMATDLKDTDGIIKAYAAIGSINHLKGDLRKSIMYYEKVIINIRMKLVRQQTQAQREREAALKEEEDRLNGILPAKKKEPETVAVEEEAPQPQSEGLFGIFKVFNKPKQQSN